MPEQDPVISQYEHEKFRPKEAEALHMLRKIASLVKPIMRQRGWRVGTLAEFYPQEQNLLGLNHNRGQKICLRLRSPYDERQFKALEEVTDTMLHELSHIVHGPHDEAFHNLWNQLREEYEDLVRKGYTGEGFLSEGRKLGGGRIPMHEARRRARAAAEKRKVLTAGSGQRLGGAPVLRGQDIRKVIADAVTRRTTITKGCASGTERGRGIAEETTRNGFRTKAEEDDANEDAIMQAFIDLVQEEEKEKYGDAYVPPSKENPAGTQGASLQRKMSDVHASLTATTSSPGTKGPSGSFPAPYSPAWSKMAGKGKDHAPVEPSDPCQSSYNDHWICPICTLENPPNYLCCDACMTERPEVISKQRSPSEPLALQQQPPKRVKSSIKSLSSLESAAGNKPLGWLCHRCSTFMENQWWTCSKCGTMKLSS